MTNFHLKRQKCRDLSRAFQTMKFGMLAHFGVRQKRYMGILKILIFHHFLATQNLKNSEKLKNVNFAGPENSEKSKFSKFPCSVFVAPQNEPVCQISCSGMPQIDL